MVTQANYKFYGETPNLVPDSNIDGFYYVYTESYSDLEITFSKQFFSNRMNVVIGGKNLFDNYTSRTFGYEPSNNLPNGEIYSPVNFGRTFFAKINFRLTN